MFKSSFFAFLILLVLYIKLGKLHGHTLALYFIFSSVLKHTIQPSYSRILNGARFGFLHFHGFFRIPLRAISMADWGAILWRIYTHIFYFTNRLLEQTTSMYIHKYINSDRKRIGQKYLQKFY